MASTALFTIPSSVLTDAPSKVMLIPLRRIQSAVAVSGTSMWWGSKYVTLLWLSGRSRGLPVTATLEEVRDIMEG